MALVRSDCLRDSFSLEFVILKKVFEEKLGIIRLSKDYRQSSQNWIPLTAQLFNQNGIIHDG